MKPGYEQPHPPAVELSFNMEAYQNEQSVDCRIKMAEDFITQAEGSWIYIYTHLAQECDQLQAHKQKAVEEETVEVNIEAKEMPPLCMKLEQLTYLQQLSTLIDAESDDPDTRQSIQRLMELTWEGFVDELGFDSNVPEHISPTLEWLRDKISQGRVVILSAKNFASDKEMLTRFLETEKSIGAAMSITADDNHQEAQTLLVLPDLMKPQTTGGDFVLGLTHEEAHERLTESRSREPSQLNETEIVFKEFFSMMEAQRTYNLLNQESRMMVSPERRYMHEIPEEERGATIKTSIPGSSDTITYHHNQTSRLLAQAYGHSLAQALKKQQIEVIKDLMEGNASKEEIQQAINKIQIFTQPVISWQTTE
ncbi:hypothetical protein KKB83_02985 [Patescibacteria group bacterium]|nr:hypothetical protein [Patescibacteria group bacterium]